MLSRTGDCRRARAPGTPARVRTDASRELLYGRLLQGFGGSQHNHQRATRLLCARLRSRAITTAARTRSRMTAPAPKTIRPACSSTGPDANSTSLMEVVLVKCRSPAPNATQCATIEAD